MRQPLSKQAQASLDLLEGEYRNESFGEEKPASKTSAATNEHLPFVMDQFAATRKSKLRVNVDSGVLKRAMAHADLAETLEVSPITSDERIADPIVIHPDVYDDEPMAEDAVKADETVEAIDSEAIAEEDAEAVASEEVSAQAEDVPAQEQPESLAEAIEVAAAELEAPVAAALPAVVGGIDPEEVAQREAEQFAKGLAQAREEAAAELAVALEAAKAEATEQALAKGKAEGLAEGLQQGLEQGKAQGLAEGEQAVRETMKAEMAAQRVLFENASNELNALLKDSNKFFEPLKRLALHIAEQVVMGELQTSTHALERLVQRCLDELDHPVQGAVVLELNPDDKARMQAHAADFIKGMRLEAVHDMQPGSVRVFANDTVVEDLLEHRLESMAKALLVDEKTWREQSVLTPKVAKVEAVTEPEIKAETVTVAETVVGEADEDTHAVEGVSEVEPAEETPDVIETIEEKVEDGDVHS
jgi:flagellar biosynthesis/type III secretory pathway protein FliH